MLRTELVLMSIILVFLTCTIKADIIYSRWVGPNDGAWAEASNWNPPTVPDNNNFRTFDVTIEGGISGVLVWMYQDRTIDSLTTYGPVHIQTHGGLLRIKYNLTNNDGGNLSLFGYKRIHGNLYNQAGAMMMVDKQITIEGELDNEGDISVLPLTWLAARHTLQNTGQMNIGGICGSDLEVLDNTGAIQGSGAIYTGYAGQGVLNEGTIYAFGGSLGIGGPSLHNTGILGNHPSSSLHIDPLADVNNLGIIEVNPGGGVAFDCNMVNKPSATVKLLGGILSAPLITQSANATFKGFGGITGKLVIDPNATISLTGPTNIVGDVQIDENATLEISDGTTLITGHTACNGTIHLKSGRIIPQGGLSGNCNIIWEPGTYTNFADFNLDGQVDLKDFSEFADMWLWKTDW